MLFFRNRVSEVGLVLGDLLGLMDKALLGELSGWKASRASGFRYKETCLKSQLQKIQ